MFGSLPYYILNHQNLSCLTQEFVSSHRDKLQYFMFFYNMGARVYLSMFVSVCVCLDVLVNDVGVG